VSMFPTFPYLAEAIAAERAADLQREAADFRRARRIRRAPVTAYRAHVQRHSVRRVAASVACPDSCVLHHA
ncbi:MAG TPA: hypothetical protein VGH96_21275, partial [Streptosporangiaceae bacterium]